MIKAVFIVLIVFGLNSCGSTKVTMNLGYGFKFKENETIVGWVTFDGKINTYWTSRLKEYLAKNGFNMADYTSIQDVIYSNLLINNLTDSTSLIKLGNLTNLDYLVIGEFGQKSKKSGRGFDILTPHEQIYHYEDFNRWRNFELSVYNLKKGNQKLFLTATTTSRGIGYGGNHLDSHDLQTRMFFSSSFKLQNKAFKKSIKQLCE